MTKPTYQDILSIDYTGTLLEKITRNLPEISWPYLQKTSHPRYGSESTYPKYYDYWTRTLGFEGVVKKEGENLSKEEKEAGISEIYIQRNAIGILSTRTIYTLANGETAEVRTIFDAEDNPQTRRTEWRHQNITVYEVYEAGTWHFYSIFNGNINGGMLLVRRDDGVFVYSESNRDSPDLKDNPLHKSKFVSYVDIQSGQPTSSTASRSFIINDVTFYLKYRDGQVVEVSAFDTKSIEKISESDIGRISISDTVSTQTGETVSDGPRDHEFESVVINFNTNVAQANLDLSWKDATGKDRQRLPWESGDKTITTENALSMLASALKDASPAELGALQQEFPQLATKIKEAGQTRS